VQNRFISSSSQLAEIVQATTCDNLNLENRGVRQAGFRVLVGAYMPAVLIEMRFLSHNDEERRLGDSSYQRRLAGAMGAALLEYRNQVDLPVTEDGEDTESDDGDGEEFTDE